MSKKVIAEIRKAYPNVSDYYLEFIIKDAIEYLEKINNHDDPIWILTLDEGLKVNVLNSIRDQIGGDILEKGYSYLYKEDKEKTDYERGVLDAIRLIEHRVHSICD